MDTLMLKSKKTQWYGKKLHRIHTESNKSALTTETGQQIYFETALVHESQTSAIDWIHTTTTTKMWNKTTAEIMREEKEWKRRENIPRKTQTTWERES